MKRIAYAPPTMSAAQMGASANPRATAEAQGLATGRYLLKVGINLDFAPVSDIPTTSNNFLGERAFSRHRSAVVEGASELCDWAGARACCGQRQALPRAWRRWPQEHGR